MNENIKEYVLKNYPTRFKKDDNIVIEERQKPVSYTHLTLPTNREV